MLYARMDETGSAIHVDFDARPTNRASMPLSLPDKCSLIFDDDTIARLRGSATSEPSCIWATSSQVTIQLSAPTQIQPGDMLAVRESAVHPATIFGESLTSCMFSGLPKCASGWVSVAPPSVTRVPLARLATDTVRSLCNPITLRATQSSGGGVYPLQYVWNATLLDDVSSDTNATATFQALEVFLAKADSARPTLFVPASLLLVPLQGSPSVTIVFSLRVASRYGGWSAAAVAPMVTSSKATLSVRAAEGATVLNALPSRRLVATIDVELPKADCPAAAGWTFDASLIPLDVAWTISRSDGTVDPKQADIDALAASQTGRQLKLPPRTLAAGESYVIYIRAVPSRMDHREFIAPGNTSISLQVGRSPLWVQMVGGEWRKAASGGSLIMNASGASYDPDDLSAKLTYTWSCKVAGTTSSEPSSLLMPPTEAEPTCMDRFQNPLNLNSNAEAASGVLRLDASLLTPSTVVRFEAIGRRDSRSATSPSALVEMAASISPAPVVQIDSVRQPSVFQPGFLDLHAERAVRPSQKLSVVATATISNAGCAGLLMPAAAAAASSSTADCAAKFQWRVVSGLLNVSDVRVCPGLGRAPTLVVLPNALAPGAQYTLELTVTKSGSSGKAFIGLRVPRAPWGGAFAVSPLSTFLVADTMKQDEPFRLSMAGWYAESDQLPLAYTFAWRLIAQHASIESDDSATPCVHAAKFTWTPAAGPQMSTETDVDSLPAGNISIRAGVSTLYGLESCLLTRVYVGPLTSTASEEQIRAATESGFIGILGQAVSKALPGDLMMSVDNLARMLNANARNKSSDAIDRRSLQESDSGEWRTQAREAMLTVLVDLPPGATDAPVDKLRGAQAVAATIGTASEVGTDSASVGLGLIRNITGALRSADANVGIQDVLLSTLSGLASADTVFSPPPPPPLPPPPPQVPFFATPPFPPVFPPLIPGIATYSPPPPQRPIRAADCFWPACWRRLDETGGEEVGSTTVPFLSDSGYRKLSERAPAEWGARANELKSAVDELAAFQASQLEPGDAPATMGSDSAIAVSIMSEFAMAAQAWQLQAQLRATVRASSHTK